MKIKNMELIKKIHMALLGLAMIANSVVLISDITSPETNAGMIIFCVVHFLTLACALYYLAMDYEKDSAPFYKAFMFLYALSGIVRVVFFARHSTGILPLCSAVIAVIATLILTFAKNLGKKNSWIVYAVLMVAEVLLLFSFNPAGSSSALVTSKISDILIAGTLGLMLNGKYMDKDARGTI